MRQVPSRVRPGLTNQFSRDWGLRGVRTSVFSQCCASTCPALHVLLYPALPALLALPCPLCLALPCPGLHMRNLGRVVSGRTNIFQRLIGAYLCWGPKVRMGPPRVVAL